MTTTSVFNLFLYPETEQGAPTGVQMEVFSTLEDAKQRGDTYDGVSYEIQCISTTILPPSKRCPEGERSTSKTILVRKTLREPAWWGPWILQKKAELLAAKEGL